MAWTNIPKRKPKLIRQTFIEAIKEKVDSNYSTLNKSQIKKKYCLEDQQMQDLEKLYKYEEYDKLTDMELYERLCQ